MKTISGLAKPLRASQGQSLGNQGSNHTNTRPDTHTLHTAHYTLHTAQGISLRRAATQARPRCCLANTLRLQILREAIHRKCHKAMVTFHCTILASNCNALHCNCRAFAILHYVHCTCVFSLCVCLWLQLVCVHCSWVLS